MQKRLYWTHILRSPPFHYNHCEVFFFKHKYTRNIMNITYSKVKKKARSRLFKPQQIYLFIVNKQFKRVSTIYHIANIFLNYYYPR